MAFLLDKDLIIVICIAAYVLIGFLTASVMVKYQLDGCDASDFPFAFLLWPLFIILGLPILLWERLVYPRWRQYLAFLEKDHYK